MARGGKRPGAGRPKGAVNRIGRDAREALAEAIKGRVDRIPELLDRIGQEEGPSKELEAYARFCPYVFTKLSSVELDATVRDGDGPKDSDLAQAIASEMGAGGTDGQAGQGAQTERDADAAAEADRDA